MLESQKIELSLGLNAFEEPAEYSGPEAWVRQILFLCFTEKGSYPTNPDIGVGLQDYEFEFIDTATEELSSEINDQIRTYLPDVPFESVTIQTKLYEGNPVLLLILQLWDQGNMETAVVAAKKTESRIDFEVSM